jgi:hypothetical protein
LAARLLSPEPETVRAAKGELASVSLAAGDATAGALAHRLRARGADAVAVCKLLGDPTPPRFSPTAVRKLMLALKTAERAGGDLGDAARGASTFVLHGHDPDHLRKLQEARGRRSTSLVRRILSVATRIWVWVAFGMLVIMVLASVDMGALSWSQALVGLMFVAAAMVCIDAFVRRCPSCRAWLAGHLLSIVQDGTRQTTSVISTSQGHVSVTETMNTHRRDWQCVFCQHRWHT